jgi:hypothetical protein
MQKTGKIKVELGETRIDGTLVEQDVAGDKVKAGTDFIAAQGIDNGDRATLTGDFGDDGATRVFYVTAASPAISGTAKSVGRPGAFENVESATPPSKNLVKQKPKKKKSPQKQATKSNRKNARKPSKK